MPEQQQPLDTWAIVEVMGHKRFAGHVTTQEFGAAQLIRVDVPATKQDDGRETAPYSKLIGVASIYCITPCTEAVAHRVAKQLERWNDPIPVSLPAERQLAAGTSAAEEIDDAIDEDDEFTGSEEEDAIYR